MEPVSLLDEEWELMFDTSLSFLMYLVFFTIGLYLAAPFLRRFIIILR